MYYIFEHIEGFPPNIIDSDSTEAGAKLKCHSYRKNNDKPMNDYFVMKKLDY